MFQLRSHLASLHNGINSVTIDILSIINQVSVISSQKLKPALLNPSDLKLLFTKLENQLVSYPRSALPQWKGENIWYIYIYIYIYIYVHETYILHVVRHPVCCGAHPLVDKSLQFNLYRIHNILLVHQILRKSFKHSYVGQYGY